MDPTNPRFLTTSRRVEFDQVSTALDLVKLLQEDAPAASWTLPTTGTRLEGQLTMPGSTDTDRRRALATWQRIIGAGPVTSTPVGGHCSHLTITGSYEGIPVQVATIVTDDAPGQVAA